MAALGAIILLEVWPPRISPDAKIGYFNPDPPRPYAGRWLLPWAFGRKRWAWRVASWGSIAGLTAWCTWQGGWLAGVLFLALPATRTNLMFPVLTDSLGMVGMVALSYGGDGGWAWIGLALLVGAINEKGVALGAIASGNAWLLVGLIPTTIVNWRARAADAGDPEWLQPTAPLQPRRIAELFSAKQMLLPWGVAVIGLFLVPPALVALAYSFLLVGCDRARLYQWIGPFVCVAAAGAIPPEWWAIAAVVHLVNPGRTVL